MIKKLKGKVFWSILLSAAGVLLAILLAINILQAAQTASKRESILDSALSMLDRGPDDGPEAGPDEGPDDGRGRGGGRGAGDRSEMLRSVSEGELGVMRTDESGNVTDTAGCADQMDAEVLALIAKAAAGDPDGRGQAQGYEYRAVSIDGGLAVSVLDAASLRREDIETALVSLAAFAAACALFALLARFLARVIVKPVEENVLAQKRFVADASHELKTPLAVIDANASVLEQSAGQSRWLDYIKEQTSRMSDLVSELLELSDLEERADQPRQKERYDAAEAVLAAVLPFESMAFEHGLTLETDVPETLEANGCRRDLEQLAGILTDNAVKHSRAGGTVRVSLSAGEKRRGLRIVPVTVLSVSNTGDTIPPEAIGHIFDRFYRADASRTNRDGSYGLGLAIAKSLAERNSGEIEVSSENGSTEFTLTLPSE